MLNQIFNIQRFSTHDGPGIRTVIFFKGCHLKCKWCHNPESWEARKQLKYLKTKCNGCRKCEKVCKQDVHKFHDNQHQVIYESCVQCGKCSEACPMKALEMIGESYDVQTIVDEVLKDKHFYEESQGGVTLSGGEPLLQSEFVYDLLRELKQNQLHTIVETTACVEESKLIKLIPYVDIFYIDYKHYDSKQLKYYTNADLTLLDNNLERLVQLGAQIVLRGPLIKGVNLSQEHIVQCINIKNKLKIEKIEFLAYHDYGYDKNQQIKPQWIERYEVVEQDQLIQMIQSWVDKPLLRGVYLNGVDLSK